MAQLTKRTSSPRPARMALFTAMVLVLTFSGAGLLESARAAPAAVRTGVSYRMVVSPRSTTKFCVGEKQTFYASISQDTGHDVGGIAYTSSQSVAGALISGTSSSEQVGSLDTDAAVAAMHGGSYQVPFTFSARKAGTTTLAFNGMLPGPSTPQPAGADEDLVPLTAPDTSVSIPVRVVRCKYKLSIFSGWTHPGERTLGIRSQITDAILEPDDDGNFTTQARMVTSAFWLGPCPGQSDPTDVVTTISGSVNDGNLHASVAYPAVQATTSEGCTGKSQTDTGHLDNLDITMAAATGVTSRQQILHSDQDLNGTSVIMLIAEELQAVALHDPRAALGLPPVRAPRLSVLGGG